MASAVPFSFEVLACFILAVILLNRYSDVVNTNIITVVGVFISWFFSFLVIFLLPADLTSTAYRQCLKDHPPAPLPTPTNLTAYGIFNAESANLTQLIHPAPALNVSQSSTTNSPHLENASPTTALTLSLIQLQADPLSPNSTTNSTHFCKTPWSLVSENALLKLWRFIYWTSQLLTWLILPIMQSYSMAGDFTPIDKLKSALRANFIYYTSFGAIFTILLVYVFFRDGIDFASLKVIAISASNTWGLFLLVVLLGYGLIELPRFLINRSQYSNSLDQQYFRVARVNAQKCEAEEELDDVLEQIHLAFEAIGNNEHSPLRRNLNKILDKCPPDLRKRSNAFRRQAAASTSAYETQRAKVQQHDKQSLTALHMKVIKVVQRHRQVTCKWNHIIREVIEWEDVIKNQSETNQLPQGKRRFNSTLPREKLLFRTIYTPYVEWYWKCLVRVWLYKIFGYVMAVFSLAVVWSEMAFPISMFSPKLSLFAYFVDSFQAAQQYFYLEWFSTISIGYLAICAFYSVFHMKIYNIYYLASNKQTDEYSLLFSGLLLCRLTAPLCLNYLCLIHRDSHIAKQTAQLETSFTTIMGHLDLIPIVNNGLNLLLPLCMSAICAAIYFNFGTHLLHSLGFEQFIENDEMTIDWVQTGRDLVRRETGKLLRNLESSIAIHHAQASGVASATPASGNRSKGETSTHTSTGLSSALGKQSQASHKAINEVSPISSSSSSSGVSGSSLLPRGSRQAPTEPVGLGLTGNPSSDRLVDNIVSIDLSQTSQANQGGSRDAPSSGGGLFDGI